MNQQKRPQSSLGFTLIELMVVVAIIGILMAAGIVGFSNVQRVARDARRRADADAIAKAAEMLYQNTGSYYPASAYANNSLDASWTSGVLVTAFSPYFSQGALPLDPLNNSTYNYNFRAIAQNRPGAVNPQSRFCIRVRLEQANGNCSNSTSSNIAEMDSFQCIFTTPGTGAYYCVQQRQ